MEQAGIASRSATCARRRADDGERREKREREDEGSARQLFTDKQTHGRRLQGVGTKPRAPARHEMLLRVTARAEQPGHLGAPVLRFPLV